jgi:hypothetical protein
MRDDHQEGFITDVEPSVALTMTDRDRHLASSFAAGTKWKDAFYASDTLVAGMAGWIRVTRVENKSNCVYYLVTPRGPQEHPPRQVRPERS